MIYIGQLPTFSSQREKRIEAHILDFNEDIYGKKIQIELLSFLRPDISFPNIEDLRKQLEKDKEKLYF
jgi:riboflavin kinase/FMN adenylyltransferase